MLGAYEESLILLLAFSCWTIALTAPGSPAAVQFRIPIEHLLVERPGGDIWDAACKESDRKKTNVVVAKRCGRGPFMDANFRVAFSKVPIGKEYVQCISDMGMQRDGYEPGCMSQTYTQ